MEEVDEFRLLKGQNYREKFADQFPDEAEEFQASKCLTEPGGNGQVVAEDKAAEVVGAKRTVRHLEGQNARDFC